MRYAVFAVLCLGLPTVAAAQSSQFGVRGLGIPIRPLSTEALATGGAFGFFDIQSSWNPASVGAAIQVTSVFTITQNFRSSTNPFGQSSGQDNRFPQIMVVGPIGGTNLAAGVSVSAYTDRSFALGSRDSITLRGNRMEVIDTLSSRGGLSDLAGTLAWKVNRSLVVGGAFHLITGSNRVQNQRMFSDTTFTTAVERTDLSYLGYGVSLGFTARLTSHFSVAGTVRSDSHLNVKRDSLGTVGTTDLPVSAGGAIRWQPSQKVGLAAFGNWKQWSTADADLKAQGGIGAMNTYDLGAGVEIVRNLKQPGNQPIRFGVRYATLPFPLLAGVQPHEFGVSAGSGIRFTGGRGGLDLSLERIWRSAETFTEHNFVVTLGISLRP